jgi:hypothetical protein
VVRSQVEAMRDERTHAQQHETASVAAIGELVVRLRVDRHGTGY